MFHLKSPHFLELTPLFFLKLHLLISSSHHFSWPNPYVSWHVRPGLPLRPPLQPRRRVAAVRGEAAVVHRERAQGDLLKAQAAQLRSDASEAHLSHFLEITDGNL